MESKHDSEKMSDVKNTPASKPTHKKEYIRRLAVSLIEKRKNMNGKELAGLLNENGFRTDYNAKYAGGRGTYTLIHATYDWLVGNDNQADADKVALAFKKPNGKYAYEK